MTPGKAVLFTVVLLLVLGAWALVRRYQETSDMFDMLAADQADHEVRLSTCRRCEENPALAGRAWCAVCAPIVDALDAEPIERGGLQ